MKPNDFFLGNKLTVSDKEYEKKRAEQFELDKKLYPEYCDLSEYARMCLHATNYHRVLQGQKEIPVPPSDSNYAKYFDKNCYELAKTYIGSFFPSLPIVDVQNIVDVVETKKTKKEPVKVEVPVIVIEKKQEVKNTKTEPKPETNIEIKEIEVQPKKETVAKKEVPVSKTVVKNVAEKPVKKELPVKKSALKKVSPKKSGKNQVDLF